MKLIDKDGSPKIELDVYEIIHDILTKQQRQDLIESLSCAEDVIQNVVDQLTDFCTENGYRGIISTGRNTALQKAWEMIALKYDHASKQTIEDMKFQIEQLQKDVEYYRENYIPIHRAGYYV